MAGIAVNIAGGGGAVGARFTCNNNIVVSPVSINRSNPYRPTSSSRFRLSPPRASASCCAVSGRPVADVGRDAISADLLFVVMKILGKEVSDRRLARSNGTQGFAPVHYDPSTRRDVTETTAMRETRVFVVTCECRRIALSLAFRLYIGRARAVTLTLRARRTPPRGDTNNSNRKNGVLLTMCSFNSHT